MGNSCETYCAYEEWGQVNFNQDEEVDIKKPVPSYKGLTPDTKSNYKVNVNYERLEGEHSSKVKKKEEQRIYWLRGEAPARPMSPWK